MLEFLMAIVVVMLIIVIIQFFVILGLAKKQKQNVDLSELTTAVLRAIESQQNAEAEKLSNEVLAVYSQSNALKADLLSELRFVKTELTAQIQDTSKNSAQTLNLTQSQTAARQDVRLKELTDTVNVNQNNLNVNLNEKMASLQNNQSQSLASLQITLKNQTDQLFATQKAQQDMQDKRLAELAGLLGNAQTELKNTVFTQLKEVREQFSTFIAQSNQGAEQMRVTVQTRLESLQSDNHRQLDAMRATVDEKLQKTLDTRITQSFKLVNDRLQEVYTGLGEMKTLANGVGDLKKVLSNVKTRGIVGEYQLRALIEELLSPEQYEENITTKKGSTTRVEFAIKLPGDDKQPVYLPVDAKFPGDVYSQLVESYELGEPAGITAAMARLKSTIRGCAKDINEKYLDPPNTTDFAIMFLPFEGLYAEVVRGGMVETLQKEFRVNIAGPSTFAALLNSLQMGFKTFAIQKRSGEVWDTLSAVKTEFGKFEDVLEATKKKLEQTGDELEKLIGTRTRAINRKLRSVTQMPTEESKALLDDAME